MDLERTRALVRELHAGQLDQIGRPYHLHLDRVLHRVVQLFPESSEATRHAALLHGSVEERKTTLAALRDLGYSDPVIEMVRWNTRPRNGDAPPYLQWIQDLAHMAPLGAVMIKIADLDDNRDPDRIAQLPPERRDVAEVYAEARSILFRAFSRRSAVSEANVR
jgi:(p)ppGpp synthase/HD superfamily hydrolase